MVLLSMLPMRRNTPYLSKVGQRAYFPLPRTRVIRTYKLAIS
jgi:hypothetical protein